MALSTRVLTDARKRRVLLTGATDGIGHALARLWMGRGERPWLHGRRALSELDPAVFRPERYLRADLSDRGGCRLIADGLKGAGVELLDRLVLNAGAGWVGAVEEQSNESIDELIDVNLLAAMELCQRLLPLLDEGQGRIVLISSVVSSLACPRYAVYAATKAALEGFARSLRTELRGRVEVQVLRPGATRTGMHAKSGLAQREVDWSRFPPAEGIAEDIDRALWGPPQWSTLGASNRFLRGLGRHLPRLADRAVQGSDS